MSLLGDFLEFSVSTPDIRKSADFWTRLGFAQAVTGDTWRHRYAVFTDGSLYLGLHEYEFESPAFTFVRPDLAAYLPALEASGLSPVFAKTGDDEFNEAGFRDPAGCMLALLEARTFFEPHDYPPVSLTGGFAHYAVGIRDLAVCLESWADLGFAATETDGRGDVAGNGLALSLETAGAGRPPRLVFAADSSARDRILAQGLSAGPQVAVDAVHDGFEIISPEGLRLQIVDTG